MLETSSKSVLAENEGAEQLADRELPAAILSGGNYSSVVTKAGGGYATFDGKAVTRWTEDGTRDSTGYFIYVRDLDSGKYWSIGYQPTASQPDHYGVRFFPEHVVIERTEDNIHCQMEIWTSPDGVELRRCTLTNRGQRQRRLELTSYLEFVLLDRDADAAHPAFSKLFVETEFDEELSAVIARRRPRERNEATICAIHFLASPECDGCREPIEYESDRVRFIGRGRTSANPAALETAAPLSGTTGSVLDPIGSLRRSMQLAAGQTAKTTFALSAGYDSHELRSIANQFIGGDSVSKSFAALEAGLENPDRSEEFFLSPDRNLYQPADFSRNGTDESSDKPHRELQFDNGIGGFSSDGREYVIRISPATDGGLKLPPMPWVNVIANEKSGFIATETGAGYTWAGNSRENRLTPWSNDPVSDPHGEALYIRDEESRVFWSPTPGPVPSGADYVVSHGFGYTRYEHHCRGLTQKVLQFVPRLDPVKITRVRITNKSDRPRRLSMFAYQQWVLGNSTTDAKRQVSVRHDQTRKAILATNPHRAVFGDYVAFSTAASFRSVTSIDCTTDRESFLGRYGSLDSPRALCQDEFLDEFQSQVSEGQVSEPCAAWQICIELAPGESFDGVFLLGEAESSDAVDEIINRYQNAQRADRAFEKMQLFWREMLSAVEIETPSQAINLLAGGWLQYQNLSCRIWGRSAFYQSGGAYGFRDQLQDSAALIYHWPELTREQIVRHASHQFVEGDVMHWWHPPQSLGIRTRFRDDLLWLPLVAAGYVRTTGDVALWNEEVRFLEGPLLEEGQQEQLMTPEPSGTVGTILEHCCRAIDASLIRGVHGLPLMGCGDWNDGMNRIGVEGRGESVWLGFFLYHILELMIPVCKEHGHEERAKRYSKFRQELYEALNRDGWDGEWYRRAFFDDGTPVGSAQNKECQRDALVQAWSILSKAAPPERAEKAIQAVEEALVCKEGGLIRLLAPAFNKMEHDPGYIKGYLPGIRENGGQYTHGVLWFIRAMAELGRGTRAVELLEMICPINHARTPKEVAVYQTEPYVVAADVYGEPPHLGRGGWSWYTGSAGWMVRVIVESVLGFQLEQGKTILLNPCISSDWPSCRISYQLPGENTTYNIHINNPHGRERGVREALLDGSNVEICDGIARIPISHDDACHEVTICL